MQNNPDSRPIRRVDRKFGARYTLRHTILIVPAAAVFWIGWTSEGLTRWIAIAVFVGWLAGLMVADFFFFRRFSCPECGTAIGRPTLEDRSPGDPILYYCPTCRIEWDTRLRESGEL